MAKPSRPKIAFYSDTASFGGHEVMTLRGVKALIDDGGFDVHFIHSEKNTRLDSALTELVSLSPEGSLNVTATEFESHRFDALWVYIARRRRKRLVKMLKDLSPDLLIVAQGDIESSCLAFFAARACGIRSASYIPLPHRLFDMGAGRLGALHDMINAPLFQLPDTFITISEAMKRKLRDRGADQTIHVVFNGIDPVKFSPGDRATERESLGLPADAKIVGMAGRFDFVQKAQDILLEAVASSDDWHAAFVGEGWDDQRLKELPKELGIDADRVHFLPWSSDTQRFYRSIDLLALPSRFEGFPLVMLESISCGTPVFASDIDGMSEFLPRPWRFPKLDAAALGKRLKRFDAEACKPLVEHLREDVHLRMTPTTFATEFVDTIVRITTV